MNEFSQICGNENKQACFDDVMALGYRYNSPCKLFNFQGSTYIFQLGFSVWAIIIACEPRGLSRPFCSRHEILTKVQQTRNN